MTVHFENRVLMCAECLQDFDFSADEQRFYFEKGFRNAPKRCKLCRQKRAGLVITKPNPPTETRCSECGKSTTVPFVPIQQRPVYCRDCYSSRKKSA